METICADICQAVKDPITITSLQISREHRLTLKGNSKDPQSGVHLHRRPAKSGRFKNVNFERAGTGQGGDFVISLDLVGVEKFSLPALRGGG